MMEENWQVFYPTFAQVFREYPEMLLPEHPVGHLLSWPQESAGFVRAGMERCLKSVLRHQKSWLESKIRTMRREQSDHRNVRALLAEIRAFGELLCAWRPEQINASSRSAGCDFVAEVGNSELRIEVHAPQSGPPEKCLQVHEEDSELDKFWRLVEHAPFGRPKETNDTIAGMSASKITGIKKREHQFDGTAISVLWVDLKDPGIYLCGCPYDHALPLYFENEALHCGFLWYSQYAEKGDPIFDQLNVDGMHCRPRSLQFNGRFNQETRIDFVIFDTWSDKIIFEKHKNKKEISDFVYKDLLRLSSFNFQLSYLDWPIRGTLAGRIEHNRKEIKAFCSAFRPP
jgi:hypothetical protein